MVVDALELNMGDDLVQPRRSFTDPDDEDEDMLSSVRTLIKHAQPMIDALPTPAKSLHRAGALSVHSSAAARKPAIVISAASCDADRWHHARRDELLRLARRC